MRKALIPTVGAVVVLAACQTKPIQQMSYSELRQTAIAIMDRCQQQGVPQGTAEWDFCLRQEVNREVSTRQANHDLMNLIVFGVTPSGQSIRRRSSANAGNSFMCKDAISRNDSGGVFIFC